MRELHCAGPDCRIYYTTINAQNSGIITEILMNYRTPGVYVEEISTLPASVAGVETAIPAFVGYTQFTESEGESVLFEPVRITSLLEYREMFGGPQPETFIFSINDTYDEESRLISREFGAKLDGDTPSPFKLYYSLQL